MRPVEKYDIRNFSTVTNDKGVLLCDKQEGAFLLLRYSEDIENLKKVLDSLKVKTYYDE